MGVKFLFIMRNEKFACNFRIAAMEKDLFLDLYRKDKVGYSLIGLYNSDTNIIDFVHKEGDHVGRIIAYFTR